MQVKNSMSVKVNGTIALIVRSLAHYLVDAVCASVLFGSGCGLSEILVYDTLAFSTQCMTGMIADRYRNHLGIISAGSCLLTAVAFFFPGANMTRAAVAGIGNSFFHTSAGASVLMASEGKAYPQGVFVAPGSIGLTVGTLFPHLGPVWCAATIPVAFLLLSLPVSEEAGAGSGRENAGSAVMLSLFAAVAVRAFGGSVVSFSWIKDAAGTLLITAAVFLGKTLGGFSADRGNVRRLSVFSITAAALLIAFGSGNAVLSFAGQFLINLTMPVTLWLMYLALPDEPGFAFGLAAAALWPGSLAGYLVSLSGMWLWLCVIICFSIGTVSILYSLKRIEQGGSCNE